MIITGGQVQSYCSYCGGSDLCREFTSQLQSEDNYTFFLCPDCEDTARAVWHLVQTPMMDNLTEEDIVHLREYKWRVGLIGEVIETLAAAMRRKED